ncbi:MAG: choice-of-anchor A family protein [Lachnospiraceae bacterium]|nr:choice-of-anchor A family protein [Lachnospiraceae bacterium]
MSKKTRRLVAKWMALMLVITSLSTGGLSFKATKASADRQYQYDASDPLYAATHFHLFAKEKVKTTVHTHGNVACKYFDGEGTNYGTNVNEKNFPNGKSDEIFYIRNIESISSNVQAGKVILGSKYKIISKKTDNQVRIQDQNGKTYLFNPPLQYDSFVFEKDGESLLDLDKEFSLLQEKSKQWAVAAKETLKINNKDQNHRFIDFASYNTKSGLVNVQVTYRDWVYGRTELTLKNLDTNAQNNGIVVLNIDLKGQNRADLTLNSMKVQSLQGGTAVSDEEVGKQQYGTMRVIYNLYDSSKSDYVYTGTVVMGKVVYGAVLAPGADLYVEALNGTAIGKNINHSGAESHRRDIIPEDGNKIEEPSTPPSVITGSPTKSPCRTTTPPCKTTKPPCRTTTPPRRTTKPPCQTTAPPTETPSVVPPSTPPTEPPSVVPPSTPPTETPSVVPPSTPPTVPPSVVPPSTPPTETPSVAPPSASPTVPPSVVPPSIPPTETPSVVPPSTPPTETPSVVPPSTPPTETPSVVPPSTPPTETPSVVPPSASPTVPPSESPSVNPTVSPSATPKIVEDKANPPISSTSKIVKNRTVVIDNTASDDTPKTGDSAPIIPLMLIFICSGIAIVTVFAIDAKKKASEEKKTEE